jgi:hypothetical protein
LRGRCIELASAIGEAEQIEHQMGAGSSIPGISLDEAQCKEFCGDKFDLEAFNAPQNGRIRTLAATGENKSETFDRWAVGSNLVVLKITCSQSGCKVQTHFLAPPVRAT